MTRCPPPLLRRSLHQDVVAFETLLAESDLTAAIPGCPTWTLGDLAGHLGSVYRWVTEILRTGQLADQPAATGDPREWFQRGWPPLVAACDEADPDAPCWGFGPPPRTAAFWVRRMAHETAMHLLDAHMAVGAPGTLDAALAADGVDEALSVFVAGRVRRGQCPSPPAAISLVAPEGAWQLGTGTPVAVVRGDVQGLLLTLWGRRALTGQEIVGDASAAAAVFALPLTA